MHVLRLEAWYDSVYAKGFVTIQCLIRGNDGTKRNGRMGETSVLHIDD